MMKKVEIEIPEGKKVEWVNGVLTLVDDTPKDIKERVKTFEDACSELGYEHPFVKSYEKYVNTASGEEEDDIAYLKLRIIAAALNEGWKPTFDKDEWRYYPWFYIYTQKEYEKLDVDEKKSCRVPLQSNYNAYANGGLVFAYAYNAGSFSYTGYGVWLALKTKELAEYCGKQFIDIWGGLFVCIEYEKENKAKKTLK